MCDGKGRWMLLLILHLINTVFATWRMTLLGITLRWDDGSTRTEIAFSLVGRSAHLI